MKKQVAKHIAASAMRSTLVLGELLPFIKKHCSPKEYRVLSRSIATTIHSVQEQLVDNILTSHPVLKKEIQKSIKEFGEII